MKILKGKSKLTILSIIFGSIWLISIWCFGMGILIATDLFRGMVDSTYFGKSNLFMFTTLGSIIVGVSAFVLMVYVLILKFFADQEIVRKKATFFGGVSFLIKSTFLILILPLYMIFKLSGLSKTLGIKHLPRFVNPDSRLDSFIKIVGVLFILIPVWCAGYYVLFSMSKYGLGYTESEISNVSGTGSMYPTLPKGTKGKDPKELSKETVATIGLQPYPNGFVINNTRYLDYKIQRGDIVTAQNDKINEGTMKIYGEKSSVIKRVVAIGGDKIEIRDGTFYLNGAPQKEAYTAKPKSTFGESFLQECKQYEVPNDSVFLMGDNRKGSGDSREFGAVKYNEITSVLPISKQKGDLVKNWRDTSNDLDNTKKPTIDKSKFIELLNQKRVENGAKPVKYQPKLDESARIRGESLLKGGLGKDTSFEVISNAMSKAGYWNTYVWEWPIVGYYEADELIEDYIERDSTDAKEVWFDKELDDIGLAEVQGELNGCPTQIIVIHSAGYVPPNYKQSDIDSWKPSLEGLRNIQSGWASLKDNPQFYSQNKADVDRINEIINIRITRINSIISTMEANKWLSSEQNKWIKDDLSLYNEQQSLADRLNRK